MKASVVCLLALAAVASAKPDYTDRYDNVDVAEIMANRRLMVPYVKCLLDQGKCAPDAKELKSHVKDALETFCSQCTEVQKTKTRQVMSHLINHEVDFWNELVNKYDPQRNYSTKYEKELKTLKA